MSQKCAAPEKPTHTTAEWCEMLHRLWSVRDTDIVWDGAPEYDDIALVLIEAGLIEPPPPEPVRWGPVHGPKTREQVRRDEMDGLCYHAMLSAMADIRAGRPEVSESVLVGFQALPCASGKRVNFHRLPTLEGSH